MMVKSKADNNWTCGKQRSLSSLVLLIYVILMTPTSVLAAETPQVLKAGFYHRSPAIFTDKQGYPTDFWAGLSIASPKDGRLMSYLESRIDQRLNQLKSTPDLSYFQLTEKWLLDKPSEKPMVPNWIKWLFLAGLLIFLLLLAGTFVLRSRVKARTRELRQVACERRDSQLQLLASEQRLLAIVDNAPSIICLKDLEGKFLLVNNQFEQLFNVKRDQLIGKTDFDIFPKEIAEGVQAQDKEVIKNNGPLIQEDQAPDHNSNQYYITKKFPLRDEKGKPYAVCGLSTNITKYKHAENLITGQNQLLELISRGDTSLYQVFEAIINFTETHCPNTRASILRLEETKLRHGAAPSMPSAYNEIIDGLEIGSNMGSCGTAAYLNERVMVADVATDPRWVAFSELGDKFGFRACWSEPIVDSKGVVLGTFALYRKEAGVPDEDEIALIDAMGHIVGIAMERKKIQDELASANEEWMQAMDEFGDAVFLTDMERRLVRANKAFYHRIGSTPAKSVGKSILDSMDPRHDRATCKACQLQDRGEEGVVVFEQGDTNNPSSDWPAEVTIKLVRGEYGAPTGMLVTLRDLSPSRRVEEQLRLAASVFENTSEGVVITDHQGNILEVNDACIEILGYQRKDVVGQNPRLWKSERHDKLFYEILWKSLTEVGQWRGEIWNRHKNGTVFPVWSSINKVENEQGQLTHYIAIFSDISHIKKSQEQLDHLAHHDALTGLPNRLLLNERLTQSIKHAERQNTQLAVIFMDLDRFKNINDSLGHPAGDSLLSAIAQTLKKTVRSGDTVARIGGDEFVLLLEDIGSSYHAASIAEKVMRVFANCVQIGGREIQTTASMGISLYPQDGKDAAELLRNADAAMYRAKDEGRNTFEFYTEELTRNAFERVLLENSLRQALIQEQFVLFYQPQVDIASGKIIGAEALIRWQHPEQGLVSPVKFIPIAEECGLIHSIGEWVLRTACTQGKVWHDKGIEFGSIAVNIAGTQIQRSGLAKEVRKILEETQLPAAKLELEITEGFIMQQANFAISQLEEVRSLGVGLAIDDFGTGYSSLSYLKKLPIHKLKIDGSFIRDIPGDSNDMAISNAIIGLGKNLDLRVVAEGIETTEQANFLRQAGCSEGQGFLYSRPVTATEFEALVRKGRDLRLVS
ncbi:MAG: EAL domain-containing protein [Pseudomonadales bacterium]|nr:EAL domain-containing protein [Pseudomonadales bacterium]